MPSAAKHVVDTQCKNIQRSHRLRDNYLWPYRDEWTHDYRSLVDSEPNNNTHRLAPSDAKVRPIARGYGRKRYKMTAHKYAPVDERQFGFQFTSTRLNTNIIGEPGS